MSRPHSAARWALVLLSFAGVLAAPWNACAQTPIPAPDPPPFSLPFTEPAGPATWLYQQHYGNTVEAFNYGDVWYEFGQGLHFGIDFEAPCGTPVHAIADGVVVAINSKFFGAGPRNIVLDHPGTGYASLYGHLSRNAALRLGDSVARGEVIGYSGDPDGSCGSRPHLHLEIRSADYHTTYNPVPLLSANWHMLSSIGPTAPAFQQDLDAPRRWMRIEAQPEIRFGGPRLNLYAHPWPLPVELAPPPNPPPDRTLPSVPTNAPVTLTPLNRTGWNIGAWWVPGDNAAVYVVDAPPFRPGAVYRQPLDGSWRHFERPAWPPLFTSPDGTLTVERLADGRMHITRPADGTSWDVDTQGVYPAISPDGTRLLWRTVYGEIVPGTSTPSVAFWVSNVDGTQMQRVYSSRDATAQWLDGHRILIVRRITYTPTRELYILDINAPDAEPQLLGRYDFLHTLRVSPGGRWIAFFLAFQENPAANAVYVQRTETGSTPRRLDAFGAYRWRDRHALYVLSYDPAQDAHALGVAEAANGHVRWLTEPGTLPIRVANDTWRVSPDGRQIVFLASQDYSLYLLRIND